MKERTLWTMVIGLAVADLRKLYSADPDEREKGRRALVWLTSPAQEHDLRAVCAMADLDVERVRRAVRAYLAGPRRPIYLHAGRDRADRAA